VVAVLAVAATLALPAALRRAQPKPPAAPTGPYLAGSGVVIAAPGRPLRFCEERFRTDDLPPRPPECWVGVDVTGVDVEGLTGRSYQNGGLRWWDAWLAGTYRDGVLYVAEQGPRRYPQPPRSGNPCGETAPGTLDDVDGTAGERWKAAHPGEIVEAVGVQVDERTRRGVYVVTAIHPEVVEAALRPAYGDALCVVRSRYSFAEIAAALADAEAFPHAGYLTAVQERAPDGQPYVRVNVFTEGPAERALVARHPEGLVVLRPWLAPPG